MALVGGGGAGNTAGSGGTAGTGKGLNYVGDHAFAYSGNVLTAGSLAYTNLLSFETGNHYIVGKLVSYGATDKANPSQGAHSLTQIEVNGESVALIKLESGTEDMPAVATVPLMIPPNAKIVISLSAESADWYSSVSFVGRVYA